MIFPVIAFIAMLTVVMCRGEISRLALLRFRATRLILITFALQYLIMNVVQGPYWALAVTHVATYVGMLTFMWLNRKIPGMLILFAGTFSNGFTIALNGGRLPAKASALAKSGVQIDYDYFTNTGPVAHAKLAFLGDIFYIPANWPMANIFSIGDIIIALGAAYCIVRVCGTRWNAPVADFQRLGGFDPVSTKKTEKTEKTENNAMNNSGSPAPLPAK
jgi:hypothetical protein